MEARDPIQVDEEKLSAMLANNPKFAAVWAEISGLTEMDTYRFAQLFVQRMERMKGDPELKDLADMLTEDALFSAASKEMIAIYEEGRRQGFAFGHEVSQDEAQELGYEVGYKAGYKAGYEKGRQEAGAGKAKRPWFSWWLRG